jgi:hypothetical protein
MPESCAPQAPLNSRARVRHFVHNDVMKMRLSSVDGWMSLGLILCLLSISCKSSEPEPEPEVTPEPAILPAAAPESPLRALNPTQYNNTVRDLLGMPMIAAGWPAPPEIASQIAPMQGELKGVFGLAPLELAPWPWAFPDEVGLDGFEGMAAGQVPSPYSIEEYQKAAIHFASYALVSPIFFTCDDWATLTPAEQASCGWTSIERFAKRAWRRPLSGDELSRLKAFWEDNWKEGNPEAAVVLTVAGILQAPAFTHHVERGDVQNAQGDVIPLTNWEMASRLSFFLWDSMPDPALFEAAYRGELSTREQVEAQAKRMLKDPRARTAVVRFHDQWLGTTDVQSISPARREYAHYYGVAPEPPLDTTGDGEWPAILVPVRHSMKAETELFIERTVFDGGGTLKALLTDNHGYMSQYTAPLYGDDATVLDGPTETLNYGQVSSSIGSENQMVLYPAEFPADQRAGILTLPSVLALGAYTVHPAPIHRGKMILERLACQGFGTPPPGAEAEVPPDTAEVEATNRERTELATSPAVCAGCHMNLNPPGFAFENYDAMGAWRDTDNGFPVDATGSVTLTGGETLTFTNGVEFAHRLAESLQVRNCYVLRWARYATGVQLSPTHEAVTRLQSQFQDIVPVRSLLVAIVGSDLFRYRRAEDTP